MLKIYSFLFLSLFLFLSACEELELPQQDDNKKEEIVKPSGDKDEVKDDNAGNDENAGEKDDNASDEEVTPPEPDDSIANEEPEQNYDANYGQYVNPLTVADFLTLSDEELKLLTNFFWVKGYIVGYVNKSISSMVFGAPASEKRTNIVIADRAEEKNYANCTAISLPNNSELRDAFNLYDHPENLGNCIMVKAVKREIYFGALGIKNPIDMEWAD